MPTLEHNRHNPLQAAERYWNAVAPTYERSFSGTSLGQIRREVVWQKLDQTFKPGQRILELSCGTGIDAVHLARRNIKVLALDLSPSMIDLAQQYAFNEKLETPPEFRVLPTEHLDRLQNEALENEVLFDGAFSNFSGLNCIDDLAQTAQTLARLLRPRDRVVLCMMGRFVPLEIVWFLSRGNVERAFRRLCQPRSDYAATTGLVVRRPRVGEIKRLMSPGFRILGWQGIGIVVPPSYAQSVATRYPEITRQLARVDRLLGPLPLFRNMADCILMEFERVAVDVRS